jgi:DNA-binding winged helix-turn-helix (wHTH) protein/tetratricopeptide (TPR) repeat protein
MPDASPIPPSVIRFGVFEADVRAGELRKSGARIRMQEQPFQILLMLLERPTQVVTRDEIRRKLWSGDVFVDFEHGVNSAVARLRDVLGDSADSPRYIETLPRRGYRFIAPVDVSSTSLETPAKPGNGNGSANGKSQILTADVVQAALSPLPVGDPQNHATVVLAFATVRRWHRLVSFLGVMAIAALAVGAYLHLRPGKLRESDSIVLADFANSTADPVFDSTLRQALAVKLGESPFLSIVADTRMRDTLRFMGRSPDERVNSPIAREICQRLGGKAMLSGQISQLGDHYYIQVEAVNCATGDSIARAGAEAASKTDTLKALDVAAAEIRRKLGESLGSIQKYDAPIEQATTTSLEALKAYSLGQAQRNRGDERAAIPFLQRAIELDPDFAMAYAVLGQAYANSEETELAVESTRKAFARRQKVGDQENFYISTHYYENVTREMDKSIETYELWQQMYPRDIVPRINLAEAYKRRGEQEKALGEILEAQRIDPSHAMVYASLVDNYISLDRLQDAKTAYAQAIARGFNGADLQEKRYAIAFFENDDLTMQHLTSASTGQRSESIFLALNAGTAAYTGQLRASEEFTRRAVAAADRDNQKTAAATWQAIEALAEVEYGRNEQARKMALAALTMAKGHDAQILAALALARAGDASQAEALAASITQQFPADTLTNSVWIPVIRAQLELNRGDAASALRSLEPAAPYDLGETETLPPLFAAFLRGEAYLQQRDGKSAAAEFEKIISHPGIVNGFLHGALAQVDLARARAISGDIQGSRAAYRDFLALWKNADPDTAIVRRAKAEYAKLH